MFFQRHLAPLGQFLPPCTCTAMEPSAVSCSRTLALSYLSAVEVSPSNSQTCSPLIQVVILGCLPWQTTRAVFQSLIFQAWTHSTKEQALTNPACAGVLSLSVSAEKSMSFLSR